MKWFHGNIEKLTIANKNFRKVLYTSKHSQLVVMSLHPKEEIGSEQHPKNDQFIRVEKGKGECKIDKKTYPLKDGTSVIIPAGAKHNIINTSKKHALKLYTIYSPAHHKDGTIHKTKEIAEQREKEKKDGFDGVTTETS